MTDGFDLDLRHAEDELPVEDVAEYDGRVILAVLDGSTDPDEWISAIEAGHILVLDVAGEINELAAPFARDIQETGGTLTHFRGFLVVAPPEVVVDTERLDS